MTISATNILTLGQVKDYLDIVDHPIYLEKIVDSVSRQIEQYLKRKVRSQTFSEIYDRPSGGTLVLNQSDVTAISLIAIDTQSGLRVRYTGTDTNARIEVTDVSVILTSRAGATSTTSTLTFASNVTTTAMVTAIAVVSGWEATLLNDGPSAYLVRTGARIAKNAYETLEAWKDYDGDYVTDYPAGVIEFDRIAYSWIGGNCQMRVDFTAGFETIPQDIERVALEMVESAWASKGQDKTVQAEGIGDYNVTYRIPGIFDNSEWAALLSNYMRVRP